MLDTKSIILPKTLNNNPRVGVGVLVLRGEQILLGKRCGEHMPGYYACPGGHLEYGETFADCAAREVMEETGLYVTDIRFLMIGNYQLNSKHYVDIDMVVECLSGEPMVREPQKIIDWGWYHHQNLPSPLFVVSQRMIQAHLNSFHADATATHKILHQES